MPYQDPYPPDCLPEFTCPDCDHLWTAGENVEASYDKCDGWCFTDRCPECGTVVDSYLSSAYYWTKGIAPW